MTTFRLVERRRQALGDLPAIFRLKSGVTSGHTTKLPQAHAI